MVITQLQVMGPGRKVLIPFCRVGTTLSLMHLLDLSQGKVALKMIGICYADSDGILALPEMRDVLETA